MEDCQAGNKRILRLLKEQQGNSIILYESQIEDLKLKMEEMEKVFRMLVREGETYQQEVWEIASK